MVERKKLKIYILGIKSPSQGREVSPPHVLANPLPRTWGFAQHKSGNYVSQPLPSPLNTGGDKAPYNPLFCEVI
ncbi:hypothetical protein [Thermococcus thioreducens]|nr:hypothetical protein [Thermococcus thioreducens]ASJ13458.1 hypothetical protein A3L14_11465 [Thermococcus thioreducens]KQH81648.1 hypothetical protein AMR53_10100 [Thermococcus thioreducens]